MKNKINRRLILIAVFAIVITTLGINVVYYELFQEQVRRDLRVEEMLIQEVGVSSFMDSETVRKHSEVRITWIAKDGTVLYDNDVNASRMENHKDRPEVKQAFQKGKGESTRQSNTVNMKNYYYAVLLDDGTVLRVATSARSLTNVFLSSVPIVLAIAILICVLCVAISKMLTTQLIQPIERMAQDLENNTSEPEYKELIPFVNMIRAQHENILSNAKSRQEFTANVSHELKTPLTAISGYAELIENDMVSKEQILHFAKEIRQNAKRLLLMIDDIIRLSELDASNATDSFKQVDLYQLAKDCMDNLDVIAKQKHVNCHLTGSSAFVLGDENLLKELIYNLSHNAIRYNHENGAVDIRVDAEDEFVQLYVVDNGIGIDPSEQERIFERFYRVDKSRSRETGGTGLGLAIVKHIVELHNAKIQIDSELGQGTSIMITFFGVKKNERA